MFPCHTRICETFVALCVAGILAGCDVGGTNAAPETRGPETVRTESDTNIADGWRALNSIMPAYIYLPKNNDGTYWIYKYEQTLLNHNFDSYYGTDNFGERWRWNNDNGGYFFVAIVGKASIDCENGSYGLEIETASIARIDGDDRIAPALDQDLIKTEDRWGVPGTTEYEIISAACFGSYNRLDPIDFTEMVAGAHDIVSNIFNGSFLEQIADRTEWMQFNANIPTYFSNAGLIENRWYVISFRATLVTESYAWSYMDEELFDVSCSRPRSINRIRGQYRDFSGSNPNAWAPIQAPRPVDDEPYYEPPPGSPGAVMIDALCEVSSPDIVIEDFRELLRIGFRKAWELQGLSEPISSRDAFADND